MTELVARFFVDRRVLEDPLTTRILARRGSAEYEVVEDVAFRERQAEVPLAQGKRWAYVTRTEGGLVKACPATQSPYLCCRYTVINQATQCPLDCSYCILQGYLESSMLTIYTNLQDMFQEVQRLQRAQPRRLFRFGTGELTDSLALDGVTGLSGDLTRFFSGRRNALLELKTKTHAVQPLMDCPPEHVVVSWSLNPQSVVAKEEFRAASIEERLKAARRCQERGFLLGFHFDPLLSIEGFDEAYGDLIRQLFSQVDAARIAWISLGSLRFPPRLKEVIRRRFPRTGIVHEEMIRGLDGKMRYPRPLRTEMYNKVAGLLKAHDPDLFVYFCMEPTWVWEAVMGDAPLDNAELDFRFAESLHRRFPELDIDKPAREAYEGEA